MTLTRERALDYAMVDELCRRSFVDFLDFAQIRSDDPLNPVVTKWQPWPYLIEQAQAWASGASEIDLKDRQLGYSWLVAAYAVWRARNGAAVALISKGQLESRELLSKCAFVEQHLPAWLQVGCAPRADDIKFPGGGFIMAFPSTPDAGVSFTFQVVVMDEAHFHPYAAQNYAAIRPTISAGGQFIALSTADPSLGPNGWFPTMYWASKRGETGYSTRFVPWSVRPGRDRAWLERERAAYTGLPEEFDAYYADTDAQAFVARSGLVFPMFSEERHVKAALIPIEQCRRVVAGLDLGGGDYTAISPLGLWPNHHVHEYAPTFYRRGVVTIDEIAAHLIAIPGLDAVECPPEQATVISTLSITYGLPAHAANNKRGDGLNLMAERLTNDTLTIDPANRDSINEFPGYRWSERTDPNDKCLIAGTLVATDRGDVPIERVTTSDAVMTRLGWRAVTLSEMNNPSARVARVDLSDGRSLTGTLTHPVWVGGRGFVPIAEMRYGDIIESWEPNTSRSKVESTRGTRGGTTSRPARVGISRSIALSGSLLSALCRMATKFTTSMGTTSITTPQTSKPSLMQSTTLVTNTSTSRYDESAISALLSSTPSTTLASVATAASQRSAVLQALTGLSALAVSAEPHFRSAAIPPLAPVGPHVLRVVELTERQPVYNLSVDGVHEFYANGILTHNTRYSTKTPVDHHADMMDARRYALMEILAAYVNPGASIPSTTIYGKQLARRAI